VTAPSLLTFPARPIQGGRLELAPPKRGLWYAEPKLNGWRTLIHTPTGTMWNRHGALLTIADCFQPARAVLGKLASRGLVWADCEALERRHHLGRGTLVVLDVIPESGTPSYVERRAILESFLPSDPVFAGDASRSVPNGALILMPSLRVDSHADALGSYQRLRAANRVLCCDFFEGMVMKRARLAVSTATSKCYRGIPKLGETSVCDVATGPVGALCGQRSAIRLDSRRAGAFSRVITLLIVIVTCVLPIENIEICAETFCGNIVKAIP
jgi:hypothetical protein